MINGCDWVVLIVFWENVVKLKRGYVNLENEVVLILYNGYENFYKMFKYIKEESNYKKYLFIILLIKI